MILFYFFTTFFPITFSFLFSFLRGVRRNAQCNAQGFFSPPMIIEGMQRVRFDVADRDGSVFSDSLSNDAMIYVDDPSQAIRIGSLDTSGNAKVSAMSIVSSITRPLITIHTPVTMSDSLEVENNVFIREGAMGIGLGSNDIDPDSRLHVVGSMTVQGGTVTAILNGAQLTLQDALMDANPKDVTDGLVSFTRGDGTTFDVNISLGGEVFDNLVEKRPPIGTLMWVFRGSSQLAPNSKFLVADGSLVSQADYPKLFEIFGNAYGDPDPDNFRLPKLTGYTDLTDDLKITVKRGIVGGGEFLYVHDRSTGETFKIKTSTMTKVQGSDGQDLRFNGVQSNLQQVPTSVTPDGDFIFIPGGSDVPKVRTEDLVEVDSFNSSGSDPILSIAIDNDAIFFYAGGNDNIIRKIRISNMTQEAEFKVTEILRSIITSRDGAFVFAGGDNGMLIKLNTNNLTLAEGNNSFTSFPQSGGSGARVTGLSVSLDDNFLFGGGGDGSVRKIKIDDMSQVGETVIQHDGQIYASILSPDGVFVYSTGNDNTTRKIRTSDMQQEGGSFIGHKSRGFAIVVSPNGDYVYSGDDNGEIYKLDTIDMSEDLQNNKLFSINGLALNPGIPGIGAGRDFGIYPLILAR